MRNVMAGLVVALGNLLDTGLPGPKPQRRATERFYGGGTARRRKREWLAERSREYMGQGADFGDRWTRQRERALERHDRKRTLAVHRMNLRTQAGKHPFPAAAYR